MTAGWARLANILGQRLTTVAVHYVRRPEIFRTVRARALSSGLASSNSRHGRRKTLLSLGVVGTFVCGALYWYHKSRDPFPPAVSKLLREALLCEQKSDLIGAERFFKEAYRLSTAIEGENSAQTVGILIKLANITSQMGQFEAASLMYKSLWDFFVSEQSLNSRKAVAAAFEYALCSQRLHKLSETERVLLWCREQVTPTGEIRDGPLAEALAILYLQSGRYQETVPLFRRAIEEAERELGKNHCQVAILASNLAAAYVALSEFDKALEESVRATDISTRVCKEELPVILCNQALIRAVSCF